MLIDWFTVSAQVANFVILVWVMRCWVYAPLIVALDAREKRIADQLSDAAAARNEAEAAQRALDQEKREFEVGRKELFAQALREAEAERSRLVEAARKAAADMSAALLLTLRAEAHHLGQSLERRLQQELLDTVRRVLQDLSSTQLEEHLATAFVLRLQQLGDGERRSLGAALRDAKAPAVLRSAFELPAAQRQLIERAIRSTLSMDFELSFELQPELVGGIELHAHGQKVAWSIANYLRSLESLVFEQLIESGKVEVGNDRSA
jgi:F-type H+-transporting ATPase subunit b